MKNWKTYKLSEITSKIGSGATPRDGKEAYLECGDISLIRSQNVLDFSFSKGGLAFISEEQAYELRNVAIEEDDILLNITGDSVARVCKVPKELLPARVNQHVAIIRTNQKFIDSNFLKYYLLEPSFKGYMLGLASAGATRNALTKVMIENFEIKAPEVKTQSRIASILSSLDNKIELNLQMNQTLEAMAQAIFKEWFVDFKFPGSSKKLVNGLPKGWRKDVIGAIVSELEVGTRPKGGVGEISEGIPSIGAESIVRIGHFDFSKTKFVSEEFFKKMTRGKGKHLDILVYKDGGRPGIFIPHVSMFGFGFPFSEYSINEHVYRLQCTNPKMQAFLYLWLNTENCMKEMRERGTGVAIPGLNSTALKSVNIILPEDEVLEQFDEIVKPIIEKILQNSNESRTLSQIRDRLLTKLVTGKIQVKA